MLKGLQIVYCDMSTTPNEGWTLLMTSARGGWSREKMDKGAVTFRCGLESVFSNIIVQD